MNRGQGRQLSVLTGFLVMAAVATVFSLFVGGDVDPVAAPAETAPSRTSPSPASTVPPSSATTGAAAPTTTAPAVTTTTQLEMYTADDIVAAIGPSVAFITTLNGSGSGVLVGDDTVVTNAHVIWPFTTVGVLFPDDNRRVGRVIGIDPLADVAVIQVDSPRLPAPMRLGSSAQLDDGATLFVVGYPAAEGLAPHPSVDAGPLEARRAWEFSGATWVQSGSPAIGGQSGGALVDEYGRLVGITTFGSPSHLYSLSVEDVAQRLDALTIGQLADLHERRPPRDGGRRALSLSFEGPWEQAAFVTWLSPGARTRLTSAQSVEWRALDPYGAELDTGLGVLDVLWGAATPGVVLAEADGAATSDVESNRPLVAVDDPDDARWLRAGAGLSGFIDVPGDRDWFYFEAADTATTQIEVEAQTRVRITLYERGTGRAIATVVHERGFFFEDPALVVEELAAGSYVVTVEDVGAQFGTYRISVE